MEGANLELTFAEMAWRGKPLTTKWETWFGTYTVDLFDKVFEDECGS